MLKKHTLIGAAVALALSAGSALAAVSSDEAAKLGKSLTPFGAEKAANAAGTIPEWTGGITKAPAGYSKPELQELKARKLQMDDVAQRDRLALELVDCLADPDAELRDGIAYEFLTRRGRGGSSGGSASPDNLQTNGRQ